MKTRSNIILALVIVTLLALVAVLPALAAGPWYVSPTGNDTNDCLTPATACLTIQAAISKASAGDTVNVAAGTYTENVNVNKPLTLRGAAGGGFSAPVSTAATAAPGVWYTDRYAPAVFESYNFGGEMVLRHGVRVADSAANRPPAYSSTFYNTQGRKLDTNLSGATQSFSIDLWVDSTWGGADQRTAGLWSTGFDNLNAVSAYPILAFRNVAPDPPGFYAFDYFLGGYIKLKDATPADYGRWHTISFVLKTGTGVEYFVDGESELVFADTDTTKLGNLILNVYNFGTDYDVYWDNFKVGSDVPGTYESAVTGQMTISASDVEVTGLYLTNPGQAYGVYASGALNNIKIANNRIQDVGGASSTAQIKGVYLVNGPDNVTISNNVFSNIIASSTKSADAINFGDSNSPDPSTGVVIQGNSFSSIIAGRGAYGILLNNGAGAPGARIDDNTFSGLSGDWTHAIGLEGPTANAVVSGNSFSNLTATGADKSAIFFEDNPVGGTVALTHNSFLGSGYYGAAIHPKHLPGGGGTQYAYMLDAESNYWGDLDLSGPGPVGTGVNVGPQADFQPWCNADFSNCTYRLPTTVSMQVSSSPAEVGDVVTMDSLVTADGVYGMQLRVSFDPTELEFQTTGSTYNAVPLAGWYWDFPSETFLAVSGGRRLSGTMSDPPHANPATLTGQSVATWKFKCLKPGTFNLTYDATPGFGTILATKDGFDIPATLVNGQVTCLAATASVDGYIKLQGRLASNPVPASWVGSQVTLTCVASSACDGFVPVPYSMTTDASGHYQWLKTATPGSGVVLGTYRVTVQRRAYLGATKAADVTIAAGTNSINIVGTAPTLLGGDVLVNSIIDIFDLTALGNSFGTSAIPADSGNDVNGDGFVNIFDLTMAGGNYEKTTSVWTP